MNLFTHPPWLWTTSMMTVKKPLDLEDLSGAAVRAESGRVDEVDEDDRGFMGFATAVRGVCDGLRRNLRAHVAVEELRQAMASGDDAPDEEADAG